MSVIQPDLKGSSQTVGSAQTVGDTESWGTSPVVQWLRIHLPIRGHEFDPWSGKIPHVSKQLNP